jgi:hypothetical protein
VYAGIVALLATPVFGQGQGKGGGVGVGGGVVGGVTGAANGVGRGVTGTVNSTTNGAANGTLSGPADNSKGGGNGPAGRGLGGSVDGVLNANQNAALATRLEPLLPPNTTVPAAAAGFENQGRFLSAVHVAHNLNIPFDQVKAQVTGENSTSLGAAIQKLRPEIPGKVIKDNVKLAERQAERDVQQAQAVGKPDKVASSIAADSRLAARLTSMLPPGTTLIDAASGFKNQGQFIAALQVSKNLNIPFADLKDRMTAGQSLGQSIQALNPSLTEAEAKASAKAAEAQSNTIRAEASADAKASVN